MNSRSRDVLLIAVALIAILGAGFGLGNIFSKDKAPVEAPPSVNVDSLEAETLAALRKSLDLTSEQEAAIRSDIATTSEEILKIRERALLEYHRRILGLHDEIAPKLDPRQQEILKENRKKLQDTIEKRFQNLLERVDSGARGDQTNQEEAL